MRAYRKGEQISCARFSGSRTDMILVAVVCRLLRDGSSSESSSDEDAGIKSICGDTSHIQNPISIHNLV